MRVIIPPTGNEVISMLKTTSLVTAVPFGFDLYNRARDISAETFNPIPLLIVASIWYLFFTSILMIGQYFLEKRFARGVGDSSTVKGPGRTGTLPVVGAGQPTVIGPDRHATGAPPTEDRHPCTEPIASVPDGRSPTASRRSSARTPGAEVHLARGQAAAR